MIEPGGTDSEWAATAEAELARYSSDGAYAKMATRPRGVPERSSCCAG